jgi:ABC-type transport system involved in multi-copper enzyme maturation permease subunit
MLPFYTLDRLLPLLLWAAYRLKQWAASTAPLRSAHLIALGFWFLLIGLLAGIGLIALGNYRSQRWLLYSHIGLCSASMLLFILALLLSAWRRHLTLIQRRIWHLAVLTTAIAVLLPSVLVVLHAARSDPHRIENPLLPPLSQDDEGIYGQRGPFHPAGLFINTGGKIPSIFCKYSVNPSLPSEKNSMFQKNLV